RRYPRRLSDHPAPIPRRFRRRLARTLARHRHAEHRDPPDVELCDGGRRGDGQGRRLAQCPHRAPRHGDPRLRLPRCQGLRILGRRARGPAADPGALPLPGARSTSCGALLQSLSADDLGAWRSSHHRHRHARLCRPHPPPAAPAPRPVDRKRRALLALRRHRLDFPVSAALSGALMMIRLATAYIALMVLLALTVGSSFLPLGIGNTVVNLAISGAKTAVILIAFMS